MDYNLFQLRGVELIIVVIQTTINCEDIYPITTIRKIKASIVGLLGIGLFALPNGILSAAFVEGIIKKVKVKRCLGCGAELNFLSWPQA